MSNVAVINPEARPSLAAGYRPQAIVPHDMDSAYRLAKAVTMAGMAPKGLDTPEKCMVAIMHGLEVGLTPMAALQRIAVVNGRPTIWGDGAIGLVRGSGLCEWVKEWMEGAGDARVAICEAKRKGEPEPVRRTFSVADAKRAGLWGKAGPWQQYPDRMQQMRARAFTLRDLFADVLGGLYVREEIEDERVIETRAEASRQTPPRPPIQQQPAAIEHPPAVTADAAPVSAEPQKAPPRPPRPPQFAQQPASAPVEPEKAAEPEHIDEGALVREWTDAAECVRDLETLDEAFSEIVTPLMHQVGRTTLEVCDRIYNQHRARLAA